VGGAFLRSTNTLEMIAKLLERLKISLQRSSDLATSDEARTLRA